MELNKKIKSNFTINGYNLNLESTKYLAEVLQAEVENENYDDFLEKIIEDLSKRNLNSNFLNLEILQKIVKELNYSKSGSDKKLELLHMIDAFTVPHSYYCEHSKKLLRTANKDQKKALIAPASSKVDFFLQRYKIIHQRTLRHELFSPCTLSETMSKADGRKKFQLKPIEYLLSSTTQLDDIIVLGMIVQLKENKFYLEDPTGHLLLNLTETKYHSGIFTEGCFVLAEGSLVDGVFMVKAIGFPPPETESITRSYFGNVNFFGGPGELNCKSNIALSQAVGTDDAMIVFLSDVWLDSPLIMQKLQTLFIGYSECPPHAFVMCGNFLSELKYGLRCDEMAECFKNLANLICQFESIRAQSHFVFIQGPQDPGIVRVYPRSGILPHCTDYIQKKVPNCHFTTNPCRIEFGSRQIVVFREDLIQKMNRNAIKIPDPERLTEDFAKTIICQAHLSPLPLHVVPIFWNYDHVMRLYPLPDLVVVADKQPAYAHTHCDCTVINPGSFPFNNYSFKVYVPSSKQIEDCAIPSD